MDGETNGGQEAMRGAQEQAQQQGQGQLANAAGRAATGPAGTATDESKQIKRWEKIAALSEDDG